MDDKSIQLESVNRAFSKQSLHYDSDDEANSVLQTWRHQVYNHVNQFLEPESKILELNAGTGIDAVHFVMQGHIVHATDLSDGMIEQVSVKANQSELKERLTFQQCSFENLDFITGNNFDYIFSNFGGLNCTPDLNRATKHFSKLLKPKAYVTLVIMPPVCPWEILAILRGNKNAFRRFSKVGSKSHLEGEYFQTYYFNLDQIKKAMGPEFQFIKSEGIGALSPPPSSKLPSKNPKINNFLNRIDRALRNYFPFNRWADHLIVTFQYLPR